MDFVVSSNQILGFCCFVTTIYGVWKIIKEFKKPNDDLKNLVDKHSMLLDGDNKRLKEIEDLNRTILQCLLLLMNQNSTDSSIDKTKDALNCIQKYLINK